MVGIQSILSQPLTPRTDHTTHKTRRHAIASFFSKAKVTGRQHLIQQNVDKLCRRLSEFPETAVFNLGAAVSAFTRDTANEFIVGKQYNELQERDFGVALSHASQGGGVMWRTTKHIRWFGPAIRSLPIDWVLKVADDGTKAFLDYLQVSSPWEVTTRFAYHILILCLLLSLAAIRTRHERYAGCYNLRLAQS